MGRHDDRWRGWHVNLGLTEQTDKDLGEYVEEEEIDRANHFERYSNLNTWRLAPLYRTL